MSLRTWGPVLGLAAAVLSTTKAQDGATVPATRSSSSAARLAPLPIAPAPAIVSAEKLSDADELARALGSGKAKVIVMLSPPAALPRTDFASRASLDVLRSEIRALQQAVLDKLPALDVKAGHRFGNIAGFAAEVSANGLRALQAHPQVVSIEPVRYLQPHLAQGIPLIHGLTYRSSYNGTGLAIAICDTGVDYNHPRLGSGGFPNSKVIGGYNFGDDNADPVPQGQAHGTCCAGIAAGGLGTVGDYIGGVAYNAKLYALKITVGSGGSASTADMVAAWDWCVTHQNDDPNNPIMVISTSFGGGRYFSACDSASAAMTTAANNAVAAGITVLASSGNEGYCDSLAWPSCIGSVISVGAVYDAGFGHYYPCIEQESCAAKSAGGCATGWYADDLTAPDKVTSYANVASFLSLFAPGNQCYTLDIPGSDGYASGDYFSGFGGTSAACPYAAGAVACLQSAAKALTGNYLSPQEVRNRLTASGDNITDTKVAITKPRVNLERAFSPGLSVVSTTLIGGNGDQSIDPNECIELRVVLRNDGFAAATNISAALSSSTPGIIVLQPASIYPNLGPLATATNATLFRISAAPPFVCGAPVSLALALTHGGGPSTAPFSLLSGSANYIVTQSNGASIVPGTADIGNHGDDITTVVSLPFPYTFYGHTVSTAAVSANGNLQFSSASAGALNSCLPAPGFSDAIFAFWDDLRTDGTVGAAQGIYTSTSGSAPNRIFNIEWRASYYHPGRKGNPVNFEVRLHENSSRFDLVYGALNGSGSTATVGSQADPAGAYTEFECNSGGLSSGLELAFQTICSDGGGQCVTGPIVNFTASPTNGILPLTVYFSNLTTAATNYSWDFGDGHASAVTNASHTYSNAGNYSVTLAALGSGGSNALTRAGYIGVYTANALPAVTNQPQGLTVNEGQSASFSVGAGGLAPLGYQWRLDGADISGATGSAYELASAQCAQAGDYQVVVANSLGSTTSSVALLAVIAPPAISTNPQSATVIQGQDATFDVAAGAACGNRLSYQWRFNETNIPGATATTMARTNAQTGDAGSYTVAVTNPAGAVTSAVAILIVNVPPAISDQPQSRTNTLGTDASFFVTASGTAPLSYQWRFNTGDIPGATGTSYTRAAVQSGDAGGYTVLITNVAGAITSATAALTVLAPPPVADFVAAPTNGAAPLTVNFTNLSTGATNYSWDFGNGAISTDADPAISYLVPGSYTVTLAAMGTGGTNVLVRSNYILVSSAPEPPHLLITPPALEFGLVLTGVVAQASFVVSNAGETSLDGAATVSAGAFALVDAGSSVSSVAFSVPGLSATNLAVRFAPAVAGAFSNTVVFVSNGGGSINAVAGRSAGIVRILSPALSGANFTFSFDSVAGLIYQVQYKDSLDDALWMALQSVAGDGTLKTVTNSVSAPTQRFFRLSIE